MKLELEKTSSARLRDLAVLLATLALVGCGRDDKSPSTSSASKPEPAMAQRCVVDPWSLILVKHQGEGATDDQIRRFQERVRGGRDRNSSLERLGWLFVTKARESFDPG